MSYLGTKDDVTACIGYIEESENTHSSSGSKILHGHSSPGGAANGHKPASETLTQKRTKLRTRTDSLVRHYGSTGSGAK